MKALISPDESFNFTWISSWDNGEPVESRIYGCQRIAQIEADSDIFDVAVPLHWVTCPDDCDVEHWYFKDGQCFPKPQDTPKPLQLP